MRIGGTAVKAGSSVILAGFEETGIALITAVDLAVEEDYLGPDLDEESWRANVDADVRFWPLKDSRRQSLAYTKAWRASTRELHLFDKLDDLKLEWMPSAVTRGSVCVGFSDTALAIWQDNGFDPGLGLGVLWDKWAVVLNPQALRI